MQNGQMEEVGLEEATTQQRTSLTPPAASESVHTKTTKTRGTVARNPRIVAISHISTILDGLDEESRGRAVRFIAEEYAEFLGD